MVSEFLEMSDSFNLTQSVMCSTHEHGHSLDLVLLLEVSVCDLDVMSNSFLDHCPVEFNIDLPIICRASSLSVTYYCIISSSTISEFLNAYIAVSSIPWFESAPPSADPVELISTFNSVCSNIMDFIESMCNRG